MGINYDRGCNIQIIQIGCFKCIIHLVRSVIDTNSPYDHIFILTLFASLPQK